jgi:hypothetical protein
MKKLVWFSVLIWLVCAHFGPACAGPMIGADAQSQFTSWFGTYGGHYLNFDELATGTQLDNEYAATHGVNFKSIRDPNGSSINKPMVVLPYGGSQEISGEPSWGNTSDGRVAYEVTFTSPQRWAGLARHFDNYYTITNFYNDSGYLIHSFHNLQPQPGFNKTFVGYLVESDDTSQWISRIECDGNEESPGNRVVGYSDDLYFSTAAVPKPAGITVTSALVQLNPKNTDGFHIEGTFEGLSFSGVASVLLEVGLYSQEIPRNRFTKSGERYTYTGDADEPGLTQLILDLATKKFTAVGANLFLDGFGNPLPIRLQAGSFDQCAMINFRIQGRNWIFDANLDRQFPCQIAQAPQASRPGLFVNASTNVHFQALVTSSPQLNKNTVQLFRVDNALNPIGSALCTMRDDGNSTAGDAVANDNIYNCNADFLETAPGSIHLAARADLGGTQVFSPILDLKVVVRPRRADVNQVIKGLNRANATWQTNKKRYGNTPMARIQTVQALKKLSGVKDARLSPDKVNIWIEFKSGLEGALVLSAETTAGKSSVGSLAGNLDPGQQEPDDNPESLAESQETTITLPLGAPCENPSPAKTDMKVGNCKVFIYSPFNSETNGSGYFLNRYLKKSKDPKFQVKFVRDAQCTLAALHEATEYGTIIFDTHGALDLSGNVTLMTGEGVSAALVNDYDHLFYWALGGIALGQHPVSKKTYIVIRPFFVSTLPWGTQRHLVYTDACFSGKNRTMARAFGKRGAKAYFGYTGLTSNLFAIGCGLTLFTGLVEDHWNTGAAYDAIPQKSDATPGYKSTFKPYGFRNLAYGCPKDLSRFKIAHLSLMTHNWYKITYPPGGGDPVLHDGDDSHNWYGSYLGSFSGATYKAAWDVPDPYNHYSGNMTITVSDDAKCITSYSIAWTHETQTWLAFTGVSGTKVPLVVESDNSRSYDIEGPATCGSISNFEYTRAAYGFEELLRHECHTNSALNIELIVPP